MQSWPHERYSVDVHIDHRHSLDYLLFMNSKGINTAERRHLAAVKAQSCSVCNAAPTSEAHHIVQGDHFTSVALCVACHRGPHGWHGDKTLWRIVKLDEIGALNITLARINGSSIAPSRYERPSKILARRTA